MVTSWKRLILLFVAMPYCSSNAIAEKLSVGNAALSVTVETDDGTMSVSDKRTGQPWRQKALVKGRVTDTSQAPDGINMTWRQPGLNLDVGVKLRLDADKPEVSASIVSSGAIVSRRKL